MHPLLVLVSLYLTEHIVGVQVVSSPVLALQIHKFFSDQYFFALSSNKNYRAFSSPFR